MHPELPECKSVESILRDEKKVITSCVLLEASMDKRYMLRRTSGNWKNGWEKIINYKLNDEEQAAFNKSADAVRAMNDVLNTLSI